MARIAGVDLPMAKRIDVGLRYIFGIGPARARNILRKTGVAGETRVKDLREEDIVIARRTVTLPFVTGEGDK